LLLEGEFSPVNDIIIHDWFNSFNFIEIKLGQGR
jgi:hypothetical protein